MSTPVNPPKEEPLTLDRAVEILGLTPFDQFRPPDHAPPGRHTGATTKMLVTAAISSQSGKVLVRGHRHRRTDDLVLECKRICRMLGLDPSRVGGLYSSGQLKGTEMKVFTDHFKIEQDLSPY